MARSPQEIFAHHGRALGEEDLDALLADYAEDAVLLLASGARRGHGELRQFFTDMLAELPHATWDLKTTVFEGDALYVEWSAASGGKRVDDGVDTFVFADGLIRLQTAHLTVQPAGA
ncbi:MAG TPA: nuclear transport factor 2 family protein [Mycobacteriales bacterium]|jgi:ketosteroid isomerase-like protein|nr:nuclear transport factor 2 family protein [Mycobacteriales bacterium]